MGPESEGVKSELGVELAGGLHVGGGLGGDHPISPEEVDASPLPLGPVSVGEHNPRPVPGIRDLVYGGVVDLQHQVLDLPAPSNSEPDILGQLQLRGVPRPGVDNLLTSSAWRGLVL